MLCDNVRNRTEMAMMTLLLAATLAATTTAPAFDHSAFDALLREHVADGLVDYDAFARSEELPRYLDRLAAADVDGLTEAERLAFWINVYNAYTIEQINAHEERDSIRNINKTLGLLPLKGPWSEKMVRAAGRTLSLDDVEHGIIRKEFDEPRIHFALVCAALGCPPLRGEAYTGARLEEQLEEQARAFLLHTPEKNRVDVEARVVWVSPILIWYKDDFGGTDASLGRYLARFWPEGPPKDLLASGRFRLRKTPYDWTLNSREKGRAHSSP
jgi:hypothetical protein